MRIIDITSILSQDLKSRARVHDLLLFVNNCGESKVIIDFQNVKFATRSFIDEFYNVFMKNVADLSCELEVTNVPEDIHAMIETVSKTQTRVKTIRPTSKLVSFEDADQMLKYIKSIAF